MLHRAEIISNRALTRCQPNFSSKIGEQKRSFFSKSHLKLTEAEMVEHIARLDPSRALPRLKRPSASMFSKNVRQLLKPIVLMDLIQNWPAATRWADPDYFKTKCGQAQIPIEVGRSVGGAPGAYSQEMVSIATFVDVYINKKQKKLLAGDSAHMMRHPLFDQVPALKEDFRVPNDLIESTPGDKLEQITASWGPAGTETPLRRDPFHYLVAEVCGHKYCRVYSPDASVYPNPNPFYKNLSQVNVSKPDLVQYPQFASATFYETILKPGEILFVPRGYWTYFKSLSYGFTVNFAVSPSAPK